VNLVRHFWLCEACKRPISVAEGVPIGVIVGTFVVHGLYRALGGGMHQHPMVCSDRCHGDLLRVTPEGWEVSPFDRETERPEEARHE
jgi:hypothetical protein